MGFPGGAVVKNLPAHAEGRGSIPGSGRSPEGGNGNPLQCSCLRNSTERGAWRITVAKSWIQLSDWAHTHAKTWVYPIMGTSPTLRLFLSWCWTTVKNYQVRKGGRAFYTEGTVWTSSQTLSHWALVLVGMESVSWVEATIKAKENLKREKKTNGWKPLFPCKVLKIQIPWEFYSLKDHGQESP